MLCVDFVFFAFVFCVYLCVLVHMYVVSTCMCGGQEDISIICEVSVIHPSFFFETKVSLDWNSLIKPG